MPLRSEHTLRMELYAMNVVAPVAQSHNLSFVA